MYKNYKDLIRKKLDRSAPPKRALLAGANDDHALEAIFAAQEEGFAFPVLIGDESVVGDMVEKLGFSDRPHEIVHCDKDSNPSEVSVRLIHEGRGDFIMKGKMETKDLLRPVLNKENGLNSRGFITHFGLMELQDYHKLLAMSDSAVIPYPTMEDKKKIVQVGMESLRKLGYIRPVIGALCAVESVNEKMPETLEARALQEMSEEGRFGDGVVVGPISYDLSTRKESALIKGYDSPYAGDVDMLLVQEMVTGNVMSKIWNGNSDNILAGCLVGADVPIVLTSRSASMKEKLNSILLCNMLS